MFRGLFALLVGIKDFFVWLIQSLWDSFVTIVKSFWGAVLLLFSCIHLIASAAISAINGLISLLGALASGDKKTEIEAAYNTVKPALDVVNTFMPLNEAIAMTVLYGSLWIGFATYRLVKSWIPSVS